MVKGGKWLRLMELILQNGFSISCYRGDKDVFCVVATKKGETVSRSSERLLAALKDVYQSIFLKQFDSTEENQLKFLERWLDGLRSIDLFMVEDRFCVETKEISEVSKAVSEKIIEDSTLDSETIRRKLFYFQNGEIHSWPVVWFSKSKISVYRALRGICRVKSHYESPERFLSSCF